MSAQVKDASGNWSSIGELRVKTAASTWNYAQSAWVKTEASGSTFTVTNSGSGAYVINGANNPTLTVVRGLTYTFAVNASGHPFWIQTVSGAYSSGNVYSTGVTNGGTAVGQITWQVPSNAPNTLYYACEFHSSMQGTINVVNNTGTWKQWFWAAVRDTFTRTTSSNLGTSDTTQTWVANSGVWFANGSVAQSNTAASSYPVASIDYGSQNAIVSASVSQGTGPAVWVSGTNNWYAAIYYAVGTTTTFSCNCVCNGTPSYDNGAATYGQIGTSATYRDYTPQIVTGSTGGTAAYTYSSTDTTSGGTAGYYTYYGSASSYPATLTVTSPATKYCVGNNAIDTTSCPGGTPGTAYNNLLHCRTDGSGSICSAAVTAYNCPNGGDRYNNGSTCYVCPSGTVNGPNPSTGSGSIASCYSYVSGTAGTTTSTCTGSNGGGAQTCNVAAVPGTNIYGCPSGYLATTERGYDECGRTLGGQAIYGYSCPQGGTPNGANRCIVAATSGGTYPNCDNNGFTCQTCTTGGTAHYVVLLGSVGGTVTTLNTITLSSAPSGIKLISSGDTLNWQAYSDTNLTTALGSQGTLTISSPSKSNFHGIVKAPSPSSQGSTVDNFSITG